jgi:hypothetical protein
MNERPFQDKKRYLWAFIIGTAIFFFVFLISYGISSFELQRVSNNQNILAYNIFSHKLNYTFFNREICSPNSYEQLTEDFTFQRKIMGDIEKKFGRTNPAVVERKKFYTIIELEHLEFIEQLNKECNQGISIILFFYSNKEEDLKKSDDAGNLLDVVYNQNQENLIIYSFDVNLNSSLIAELKKKYEVQISPTIIVNGNKITSPQNIAEIEKFLK